MARLLLGLAAPWTGTASASDLAPDLHAYWDQRCKGCHGDAGGFARRTLQVRDGKLIGAHHRDDLAAFLRHHGLAEPLRELVTAMLTAQVTTRPLFKRHCAACHDGAAELVRRSLVLRGDALVGRSDGRAVADLLSSHGGLGPDDQRAMTATLVRVAGEVGAH